MLHDLYEAGYSDSFGLMSCLLREKYGKSLEDVMGVLEIDRSNVEKFERGEIAIRLHEHVEERLPRLAALYGCQTIPEMVNQAVGTAVHTICRYKGISPETLATSLSIKTGKPVSTAEVLAFENTGAGLDGVLMDALEDVFRYVSIYAMLKDATDGRHRKQAGRYHATNAPYYKVTLTGDIVAETRSERIVREKLLAQQPENFLRNID